MTTYAAGDIFKKIRFFGRKNEPSQFENVDEEATSVFAAESVRCKLKACAAEGWTATASECIPKRSAKGVPAGAVITAMRTKTLFLPKLGGTAGQCPAP